LRHRKDASLTFILEDLFRIIFVVPFCYLSHRPYNKYIEGVIIKIALISYISVECLLFQAKHHKLSFSNTTPI